MDLISVNREIAYTKLENLHAHLKKLGRVAIAFSSGVDSTFLLKTAHDTLGDNCIAITAKSRVFPERESREADEFCSRECIRQVVVYLDQLKIEGFKDNPPDRCYLCKRSLFAEMQEAARREGFEHLAEGSNMDDLGDYRPGLKAIAELRIESPLRKAELTKAEIRFLSRDMGLPTWDKPSYACLASRFVYGEEISEERLQMVDKAEQLLLDLGLGQVRVRIHANIARIEVSSDKFSAIIESENRKIIYDKFREYGFAYVALDLLGYRTGSMNETLH